MKNLDKLYSEGLDLPGGKRFRFLLLGVKGDLPFLQKAAFLVRTFLNVRKAPKTAKSKRLSGCCHLCLAGTEEYNFEDFATSPCWLPTTGQNNPYPWERLPPYLEYMPHVRRDAPSFFRLDIMHLLHLGFGRDFCGSSLVLLLELYNADSIPVALDRQTADLAQFLQQSRRQIHFKRLSRDMLGYKNEHSFPTAHWSKAMDTPVMAEFIKWLLDQQQTVLQEDRLLRLIHGASQAMGVFMRTLLKAGLWLTKDEAAVASEAGLYFLQAYAKCARICADRHLCRYNLTPKLHFFTTYVFGFIRVFKQTWLLCRIRWRIPISPTRTSSAEFRDYLEE